MGAVATAFLAACTAPAGPTLADLGATELAGQNGEVLDHRCGTLPMPEAMVTVSCSDGGGATTGDHRLDAGTYAVVLLCETSGSFTLRSKHPPGLFEDVVVDCSEDADPAVRRAFELDEATQLSLESAPDTSGASVAMLVRED